MAKQSGEIEFLMLMGCFALRLRWLSAFWGIKPPEGCEMKSMCRINFSKNVFIAILLIGYWIGMTGKSYNESVKNANGFGCFYDKIHACFVYKVQEHPSKHRTRTYNDTYFYRACFR
jgi:hypothetical protein